MFENFRKLKKKLTFGCFFQRLTFWRKQTVFFVSGDKCENQSFQKRIYPGSDVFKTSWGGWGLKSKVNIKKVYSSLSGILKPITYFN